MPERTEDDACDLLDADHLAVKHLFVEYARLAHAGPAAGRTPPAADDRATLAATLCDELTRHAQIEEELFYPALRQALPDSADVLDDAEREHAEAKALIAQIRQLGTADETMDRLVAELAGAIGEHVKEERDELFPKARSAPGLDLAALGAQLSQRQQALAPQG